MSQLVSSLLAPTGSGGEEKAAALMDAIEAFSDTLGKWCSLCVPKTFRQLKTYFDLDNILTFRSK